MRSRFVSAARAALVAVAFVTTVESAEAQGNGKALVYCPVGIDDVGCNAIVNALAPVYLGGVDKGYDGSGGTINLATADLGTYGVFVVPSLADGENAAPYGMLRDPAVAHRLRDVLLGRVALWSGSPDIGTSNRGAKDGLIRSLTKWASDNYSTVNGPGIVAFLDQSENAIQRYDWLEGLVGLNVLADTELKVYSSVRTLDDAGAAILTVGGITTAYANMASFGFYLPAGAPGVSLSAVGQTGTSAGGQVVLLTSSGGNAGTASVMTDKDDYAPGTTVTITGSGFKPNEVVTIVLHEDPLVHENRTLTATADGQGNWVNTSFSPEPHHIGVRFVLTATGNEGSVAQTTFTDGNPQTVALDAPTSVSVTAGNSAGYTARVVMGGTSSACTVTFSVTTTLPAGASASFSPNPVAATNVNFTSALTISTTAATPAGSYPFTVQAARGANCQGNGNLTTSGTLVVTASNVAPILDAIGNKSVNEGTLLSFTATATDATALPLTFSLDAGAPAGAAITAAGAFTFTPSLAQGPGAYPVTIRVTDSGSPGLTDTETITITVVEVNSAPTFTKGANQTVNEDAGAQTAAGWATAINPSSNSDPTESGQTVSFTVTNDNNALFSAQPAVAPNGTLSFTPATNAFGSATVTIYANDDGGTANGGVDQSANQTFTITVNPVNDEPSFTKGANETVNEDAPAQSVASWATAISSGPPNEIAQSLSFTVTNDNNALFSVQPAVSAAGLLSYTPAPNAHGTTIVSVYLMDDGGTANGGDDTSPTQTFTITITAVNDPPTFTKGADQTVNEDAGAQIVNSWATAISPGPNESTQSVASFTVTNDNSALFSAQPAVSASGNLTYTPAANAYGSATVSIKAVDNLGAESGLETFTITVNAVNDEPSFTKGNDETVNEDAGAQSVSNWATAISKGPANESSQTLVFTVTATNTSLFSAQPAVSSTGTLTYTPAPNANGSTTVSVYLMDDGGTVNGGDDTSPTQTFTITVNAVNDAPGFTKGADQTVIEDAGAQTATGWATGISAGPADENSQTVSFTVSNNNNGLFTVQPAVSATGTLTFTPAPNAFGSATVTIYAKDNGGTANAGADQSADQTFTITVKPVNDEPSFTKGPDQTVNEDAGAQAAAGWATAISSGPANESGQTLTFHVSNDNNSLFSVQPAVSATGTLTYTPAANAFGSAIVSIYLTDDGSVADGGDDTSPTVQFTINVNSVNDEPSFTPGADVTVNEDSPAYSAGWATAILAGPGNESGQTVSFNVSSTNSSLFSVAPAVAPNGTLTFTPAANAFGSSSVSITLSDNGGTANGGDDTSPTVQFTISISPVNDEPSFTKGPDQTVNEDAGAQTVNPWATAIVKGPANESSQTVSFNISNDNNALFSVQPAVSATGVLTYTPAPNAFGSATVTLNIQDNGGTANGGDDTSADQTFTITVNSVNDAPSFTKGGNQTVNEDAGVQTAAGWATGMSVGPANENSQTFTFHVSNDNNALFSVQPAVNATTGDLTYTLAANAFGTTTVTVYATDNGGTANGGVDQSPNQTFTITVNAVNDEPSFTKGADQTVNEDAGAQTVNPWATAIVKGPANESGQTVSFNVSNNNNALFSVQPAVSATGVLTYTPAANAFGSATVTLNIEDNGGTDFGGDNKSDDQTFTITVNSVNDAPSFLKGANQTVNEDAAAQSISGWATSISFGPANEAPQTVNFTVTTDNSSLFSVQPAVASDGTLTYALTPNANGVANVTIFAKDNGGTANGGVDQSANQYFTITVNAVNDEPSFTKGADQTVNEDAPAQSVSGWATAISAGPTNESSQTVSFNVSNNNNALFSVQPAVSPAGVLTYTLAPNAFGSATVTLNIKDDGGIANGGDDTSADQTFTITANSVNDVPVFTKGADQTVNEDAGAQTVDPWATGISVGPANESSQTLAFTVTNSNNALFSTQPAVSATGVLTYTPAANANGSATVTIYAKDNGGVDNGGVDQSANQTFLITVRSVNDEPSFTKGADQTKSEDSGAQSVPNWATAISKGPADENGQTLTFTLSNNNNALFSVQPAVAANGTLTYTPAANANGSAIVDIYLKDNGGTAYGGDDTSPTVQFTITITEVNDKPAITVPSNQTIMWGNALSVSASATDANDVAPVVTPLPPQTLTFSLITPPAGMTIDGTSGLITWTPTSAEIGPHTITVRVTDNGTTASVLAAEYDQKTFTVDVGKRATKLVYNGVAGAQYSDLMGASALLTDNGGGASQGAVIAGETVTFTLGAQGPTGTTNASGVATSGATTLTQNPALTYTMASSYAGNAIYSPSSDSDPYDITQEDARIVYSGVQYWSTPDENTGTAQVTLRATVHDISATGDAAGDTYSGDIRNARVTFRNGGTLFPAFTGCSNLTPTLVNPADLRTGIVSCVVPLAAGTTSDPGEQYVVGMEVTNYYTRLDEVDNDMVTVVRGGTGFVTGGGYQVMATSAGQWAATLGARTNYGFNVKFNKQKTNIQGKANVIFRRLVGGVWRVYQIKTNSTTSLTTTQPTPTTGTAVFAAKASLTDITNPLVPATIASNLQFTMSVNDNGEPGAGDRISISLFDGNTLLFASSWNGSTTIQQLIDGGNIQVRQ